MADHDSTATPGSEPSTGPPVSPSPRPPVSYRLGRLGRLVRKELCEILRDRRTIITLVLMPLLLYPLLTMAFRQFAAAGLKAPETPTYKIVVVGSPLSAAARAATQTAVLLGWGPFLPLASRFTELDDANDVRRQLDWGEVVERARAEAIRGTPLAPPHPDLDLYLAANREDLERAVRRGNMLLGIEVQARRVRGKLDPFPLVEWKVYYLEHEPQAREALAYVERYAAAANVSLLQRQLAVHQWGQQVAPIQLSPTPLREAREDGGLSRTALIPLILILMTITGAVYPAIDLTAGERERGTLEILVAAPVPRLALLFAKYVSVVTVAVLTAVVNLVMMVVTLELSGLGQEVFGGGLTVGLVLGLFALLLLFAAFFSAVLLTLTSFARSFKEAQAYLIPLMLVSLAPGLIGMMPGLKLGGIYAVTPLLNIVLLSRDLLAARTTVEPAMAAVVILSTVGYAVAAIAGAARIFGAEGVLYSEQGTWSDLFRRPLRPRPTPTLTGALGCLALTFPAYFVIASLLRYVPPTEQLTLQVLATALLFALLPLGVAVWGRVRVVSGFQLYRGPWLAYPAALVLGLGFVPLVYELLLQLKQHELLFIGRAQEAYLRTQLGQQWTWSPGLLAGSLAAIGVLEELFFRGYLFSALRSVGGAALTVLGSGLLFGLFHAPQALDRLLPSTLMGVVLGWVCWQTGSVLPGMLLHGAYNFCFSILPVYHNSEASGEGAHLPLSWIAAGVFAVAAGAALIRWSQPPALPTKEPAG